MGPSRHPSKRRGDRQPGRAPAQTSPSYSVDRFRAAMTPTFTTNRLLLDRTPARSLAWHGDDLVDLVAGGRIFRLDGTVEGPTVFYAYRFDPALIGPDSW